MINENKVHPNTIRKQVFVIEKKLAKDFNLIRSIPYNSGIEKKNVELSFPKISKIKIKNKMNSYMFLYTNQYIIKKMVDNREKKSNHLHFTIISIGMHTNLKIEYCRN
ncbi:coiled-coil domain-containing protein 81-like [Aphis craccivora]|uniref:Coiled-coil domain-containing protein 81-like n=1 Tax=Aphis craccivora TaxID=307492 RepID=A0A6G0ZEK7_APHCR|nr:coiled-coil domain-containing protein 81-like [Aphis craccivora]